MKVNITADGLSLRSLDRHPDRWIVIPIVGSSSRSLDRHPDRWIVIPAKAGIQNSRDLDSGIRRNDEMMGLLASTAINELREIVKCRKN